MHNREFFGAQTPQELLNRFGSPLYVYNEEILKQSALDMVNLVDYRPFKAHFSCKANSNLAVMRLAREMGMDADAMSPGEITLLEAAGFKPEQIFFIPNNISDEELLFAAQKGILVSLDSLSQLERFGRLCPNHPVAVRFNTGHGVGHDTKVITAGAHTKFGINDDQVEEVEKICTKYNLTMAAINEHLGSHFLEDKEWLLGVANLLRLARRFPKLEFVDIGGGFGIPYLWRHGEKRLNMEKLRRDLTAMMEDFAKDYGRRITFYTEPGRYVVAEGGAVLGQVNAIKYNGETLYVGTDVGFNVLQRPLLYHAYHEMDFFRGDEALTMHCQKMTVVGNICESGDMLCQDRPMPLPQEGDVLCVWDAGAYGFSMSSDYNQRLRPAEVMIDRNGQARLIRRRESIKDILAGMTEL